MNDAGTPQVVDRRAKIIAALPRNAQSLVLGGIAFVMILIILFSGHQSPKPTAHPTTAANLAVEPNQAHIQDYRALMDDQVKKLATEEAELSRAKGGLSSSATPNSPSASPSTTAARSYELISPKGSQWATNEDPDLERERHRREYQSLFASNMALSYRSASDKAAPPSSAPLPSPISESPRYLVPEGTFFETVLTNRLDSSFSGPIDCMVTTNVYSHDGQTLLIPQGSRVLGQVRKVDSLGEQRLSVSFHRLLMPDQYSVSLDQFQGLDQTGETGLRDQVNHHYVQMFGVSAALGLFAGLSQANTRYSLDESPLETHQQGVSSSVGQSASHVLDRYLNVLPTFTIREGYRVKVYLSKDLLLPAYDQHPQPSNS